MKLGPVQQLAEDQRDLFLDDAGPVVLDAQLETVLARLFDVDPDLGQDSGLFARVQRVVHGLFNGGQQGFPRVVKTQQMPVLGKELADGNVPLFGRHRFGGRPAAGLAIAGRIGHRFGIQVGVVFGDDQRSGQRRHSFTAGASDARRQA